MEKFVRCIRCKEETWTASDLKCSKCYMSCCGCGIKNKDTFITTIVEGKYIGTSVTCRMCQKCVDEKITPTKDALKFFGESEKVDYSGFPSVIQKSVNYATEAFNFHYRCQSRF